MPLDNENNKRQLTTDEENEKNKKQKVDSNNNNSEDYINNLPNEILHKIGGFFDQKERIPLALTNKKFKIVVDNLYEQELKIVLQKLGFVGRKDNKFITLNKSIEIHKKLKTIQEQTINFINLFNRIMPSEMYQAEFMIKPIGDMLDNLYLSKELVEFKINWANVFDNAIHVKITNDFPNGYNVKKIINNVLNWKWREKQEMSKLSFYRSLILGVNEYDLSLAYIITKKFNDVDCKDVLKLLIEKYKANFLNSSKVSGTTKKILEEVTNRNLPESIAYMQNVIQQEEKISEEEQSSDEEQINFNNQP